MTIEQMKERKIELGYTNEKVAELSGVPLGTVQKIFAGETRSPRYDTIQKLQSVLAVRAGAEFEYAAKTYAADSVSEPEIPKGMDYYDYRKHLEKKTKKIHNAEYSVVPIENRLGIADGAIKIPNDDFFYDDEIADLFEEL